MSNEDMPRGLNILCIDGAGARGLSSLIVLQEAMNRLGGLSVGNMGLKPADCFDVITGSGTGGLSACMIGRLRVPLDSAIQKYAKLIEEVFADKKVIRASGPSAYKGTKLRGALQQIIAKSGNHGEKMEEEEPLECCKTIVFAMSKHNMNAGLPTMLRPYRVTANRGPDCTILDALYATMAHPNLSKDIETREGALQRCQVRRASRFRKCPAPTPVYTGRKVEAKQIIGCILENGDEHPICVIYGLGGSGKTQLALKVVE
ncbi:unnamed protein product [Rhizoctonia solani]|uniref:PNPLA domain-containing protein n=1 Tax=Rhizoctonia solani TaxID=456999 RepID=A0A8H3DTF3_9AGAM|nr:unnamed protein product [Rhizoctonia solani]